MYLAVLFIFGWTTLNFVLSDVQADPYGTALLNQAISTFTCKKDHTAIATPSESCSSSSYTLVCVSSIPVVNQPAAFTPGDCVSVIGTPTWDFIIDVWSSSRIIFQMANRFSVKQIKRDYYTLGGQWALDYETDLAVSEYPLTKNLQFNVTVCAQDSQFQVCVDGVPMFNFTYRYPLSAMTRMELHGAAEFKTMVFYRFP